MVSRQQCLLFVHGVINAVLFVCLWYYNNSAFGLSMVYSVILSVAQTVKNQTLRQCVNNEVGVVQKKVVKV